MICVENVKKSFGKYNAVNDISFKIPKGSCFSLLGPNGAGKTTTIKMIQTVLPMDEGKISVDKKNVGNYKREIKSTMGVMPQDNNLDPDLTVLENLIVYARYFNINLKEAKKRAENLLEFMQLTNKQKDKIMTLSGGLQRRLVLARALINNPEFLILDEPTTGLDPQARHLIWHRLFELKNKGITILLTTHYMEEAEKLSDIVAIMDNGKILQAGYPQELIKNNIGEECIEIESADIELEKLLKTKNKNFQKFFNHYFIYDTKTLELLKQKEFNFNFISQRKTNLEDLFLKLTGRTLKD